MKICLVGPCSPVDLNDLLTDFDISKYSDFKFYRGIPVSTLAAAFLKAGHEVEIISTATGSIADPIILHGKRLKFTIVKGNSSPRNRALSLFRSDRKNLSKVIRATEADIFHAHWIYEFALATLQTKKNVIVTAHDSPVKILFHYLDAYRLLRLVLAIVVRIKCKYLTAVSPYLAQNWRKQMLWFKNIEILPNLIPTDFLKTGIQVNEKEKFVLCVSDSSNLKNVKTLITAWHKVNLEMTDYRLVLVGYGLGKDEDMNKWADRNGLDYNIEWTGYINRAELHLLFERAMLLCHPSLEESHCLVLLEASSLGLPIIAGNNSGAVPWTLKSGGYLIDAKSPSAISSAILRVIRSPDLRNILSQNALENVRTNYSQRKLIELYLNSYQEVINQTAY